MKFNVKCLIKADEPNVNGNIYPREVLEKMIGEALKNKTIYVNKHPLSKEMSDIVAKVDDIVMSEDGDVSVDIIPIDKVNQSWLEENDMFERIELNSTTLVDLEDMEEQEDGTVVIKSGELVSFSIR